MRNNKLKEIYFNRGLIFIVIGVINFNQYGDEFNLYEHIFFIFMPIASGIYNIIRRDI